MNTTESLRDRPPSPSYAGLIARLAVTLALTVGIAASIAVRRGRPEPAPVAVAVLPVVAAPFPTPPAPKPVPAPAPAPRPAPPDRAAIARAEAAVDSAARDRGHAEARLADAEIGLSRASLAAAADARASKTLATRIKDPTARIERAANRLARAAWEVKRLEAEVDALAKVPRTKAKTLVDQGAVAKPIDGKEFHFEVRGDRVAFIDIDKLSDLVKSDVRLRMRLASPGQPIGGSVGPVGDFSMHYEMGPTLTGPLAELLDGRVMNYQLQGWEIVPGREGRGVTYEAAWGVGSEFARAVGRLNPSSSTITLWIYPDGFALYRRLRDDLHARGFLVAARPLPGGMAIRGSPVGSLSAGQ